MSNIPSGMPSDGIPSPIEREPGGGEIPARPFGAVARHLLALQFRLSESERTDFESAWGISVEEVGQFATIALDERDRRNAAEEKADYLKSKLEIDEQTGTYTPAATERLFSEIAISSVEQNRPMFAMYVDIDNLKEVNAQGEKKHDTGDVYIRQITDSMSAFLGPNAAIIRLHGHRGDEFFVIGSFGDELPATTDAEEDWNIVMQEAKEALRVYVRNEINANQGLMRQLAGAINIDLGVGVGGVFSLPEDVLTIAAEVNNGTLTIDKIIQRVKEITDDHMFTDKSQAKGVYGPVDPRTQTSLRFEYRDLHPPISKFRTLQN